MYFDIDSFADKMVERYNLIDENNLYDMKSQVDKEIIKDCGDIDKMYEAKNQRADQLFSKGIRTVKKVNTKSNSIKRIISFEKPKAITNTIIEEQKKGKDKLIKQKADKAEALMKSAKAQKQKETQKAQTKATKPKAKIAVFSRKSIENAKTAKLDAFTKEVGPTKEVANKTRTTSKEIGIKHKRNTGRDGRQ